MQERIYPSKSTLWAKWMLSFAAVGLVSILIVESALAIILPLLAPEFAGLHFGLFVVATICLNSALMVWFSRSVARRLERIFEASRVWLRGNLAVRIADGGGDDLSALAEQLDLLAEHLEQDEQDLEKLRERNTRLTDQVRALAVAQERSRLARELHDSVKQYLFSLTMTAGGLRKRFDAMLAADEQADPNNRLTQLLETVREMETTAQTAQREMTRLIKDLKPVSLEKQGLAAALNDYALLFGAREHILAYVDVQGNDMLLSPSAAEALYRVAQEALHNIARHARATRVDVRLRCLPEQAILTVRDNGVGFDRRQARQGLGTANMQDRMMSVGGQVSIDSKPGRGTTVTAKVALAYTAGMRAGATPDAHTRGDRPVQGQPKPQIENWAWLGQKLVIPVGQVWPWLPADQVHLRQPLVEPAEEPLLVTPGSAWWGLSRRYVLSVASQRAPLALVRCTRSGYHWKERAASWALRYISGAHDKMALLRNDQPLAALQSQGKLLNAWSEIVYDGRGYRLSCAQERTGGCALVDQDGDQVLLIHGALSLQVTLCRALPLPLVVMAIMRNLDETSSAVAITNSVL